MCAGTRGKEMSQTDLKRDLSFLFFIEAVVGVVYNHCQCCVPKTHLFIPLSALYSTRAERWRLEREETLLCFRGSFCKNWESLWWVCLLPGSFCWGWDVSVDEEGPTRFYCRVTFPPWRIIAALHKSFCCYLCYILSMSWNAMFLVLLTLYSVIHFIINSLPNASVVASFKCS